MTGPSAYNVFIGEVFDTPVELSFRLHRVFLEDLYLRFCLSLKSFNDALDVTDTCTLLPRGSGGLTSRD